MFDIECEKCGGLLIIDQQATSRQFYKDMDYITNDVGEIVEKTLQNYLIYRCKMCGNSQKYTYKDWELMYRKRIANDVMTIRKINMFKSLNPETLNPDNGIDYCGQCSGYGGDGYCLNDIIKQCTIRK
jgi:hypothetical protein